MPSPLLTDPDAATHLRTNLERVITDLHLSVPEFVDHLATKARENDDPALGVSTIRRVLSGNVTPRAATVRRLATYLDTTPAALLTAPRNQP